MSLGSSLGPIAGLLTWVAAFLSVGVAIVCMLVLTIRKIQLEALKSQLQKETRMIDGAELAGEGMRIARDPGAERARAAADLTTRRTNLDALTALIAMKTQQLSDDGPRYRKRVLGLVVIVVVSIAVQFLTMYLRAA